MSGYSIITQEAAGCDYGNFDPEGEVRNGRNINQVGGRKMRWEGTGVAEGPKTVGLGEAGSGASSGKAVTHCRCRSSCRGLRPSAWTPIPSLGQRSPLEPGTKDKHEARRQTQTLLF